MYVCMYVCMYMYMYMYMFVFMYVCMHACMYVSLCICMLHMIFTSRSHKQHVALERQTVLLLVLAANLQPKSGSEVHMVFLA